jgi:hypothetical protein
VDTIHWIRPLLPRLLVTLTTAQLRLEGAAGPGGRALGRARLQGARMLSPYCTAGAPAGR